MTVDMANSIQIKEVEFKGACDAWVKNKVEHPGQGCAIAEALIQSWCILRLLLLWTAGQCILKTNVPLAYEPALTLPCDVMPQKIWKSHAVWGKETISKGHLLYDSI